ncbi:MAG: response regulator [Deltaproteobacteria bacterium]|nr:response regulator [Deltaproteobacteria bacterium]
MDPRHDREILAVFVAEAREYLRQIGGADPEEARRAIHGIKGAAGMMGLDALYRVISEHERRHDAGDRSAAASLVEAIRLFLEELVQERESFPPGDLEELDRYFETESSEHLQAIGRAIGELGAGGDPSAAEELRRALHTLKGAADAVGRTEIAQAAHAMEDVAEVMSPSSIERLAEALPLLAAIVAGDEESASHLKELRALAGPARDSVLPPPAGTAAEKAIERRRQDRRRDPEGIIRVETRTVDGLIDGVGELSLLGQRLGRRASAMRRTARDVAASRRAVAEALRAIGPARPWGPPAAALTSLAEVAAELSATAAALDAQSDALAVDEETARRVSHSARADLGRMRMAPAKWLFERVTATIDSEARRMGRTVIVESEGTSVEIDRALAERLVDPMVQLARNAVVHGIEDPQSRAEAAKPLAGTMVLGARVVGGDIALLVSDDGRGIDVERIRNRAVELGLVSPQAAVHTPADEILESIFLPGFSTRTSVDEHAGRGVGLDVVRREVERLGGKVQVRTTVGAGTTFEVRFQARLFVLWALLVRVGDQVLALPLYSVREVTPVRPDVDLVPLGPILGLEPDGTGRPFAVHIATARGQNVGLIVDAVDGPVELVTRRMPPLLEGLRPYLGTAITADGRVTLVLDAEAIPGARAPSTVRPRRLRALVVEDSATTRELLGSILRRGGVEVELAADGRQALRRMDERDFDVVVTDLAMPNMDGRTLVQRIRADPRRASVHVVIVTSRANPESAAFATEQGAVLLAKPVSRHRFLEVVKARSTPRGG